MVVIRDDYLGAQMDSSSFFGVMALLTTAPSAFAVGEAHMPRRRRVKSIATLRKQVAAWRDSYNPTLTEDEVDDLTGWLNRNFYHLEK